MRLAKRIDLFSGYLGVQMNAKLTGMKAAGKDVINLGLGDPDVTPPQHLLDSLRDSVSCLDNHHYPSFYSSNPLTEAIAGWYQRRFGVVLNPRSEVLPLLGSSEGLYHIMPCLLDVGDVALIPDPAYPTYEAAVRLAGGEVEFVPLLKENGFLPDLDAVPRHVAKRAKLILVNYPNNPTGAVASLDFYRKLVHWARENDIAVISDNPYTDVCFEGYRAPSLLEIEGAKENGVEFNSLSKSYNCCGWRTGMVVGSEAIIAALAKIKSHSDRGMFYPLQVASVEALTGPDGFMEDRNRILQERRDVVVDALRDIGLEVDAPRATFYIWASVPSAYTSQEFCFAVLEDISVWMIPGSMYGEHGEGYLRIALTHPVPRLVEAMDRLKRWMEDQQEYDAASPSDRVTQQRRR